MANMTSRKNGVLASGIIAAAVALIALVAYPTYAGNVQADPSVANVRTVTINAKGYAFQRIDEETLKQFNAETQLTVTIGPRENGTTPSVGVTGTVKINDAIYTIQSGTAVLGTKRHILFIRCGGIDEEGNKITLKFGAVFFWWGVKTYALRSIALLQTIDKPMLLLQRGIAQIQ